MKRIVVIVLMMAACLGNAQAQLHLKANVQNNHLWRGMEVSDGIVLLTDLSYTMANDHVTWDFGVVATRKAPTRSLTII